jgi:hypothetical protein
VRPKNLTAGDQLAALLSQPADDNTPTSVPSSSSNIRDEEASSTPPDLSNSEQITSIRREIADQRFLRSPGLFHASMIGAA